MGEKLIRYYKFIEDKEGLPGKMKLAQETKIPSIRAAMMPDNAENVKLFREAIKKLTGVEPPDY